jgi:hypothetical protein
MAIVRIGHYVFSAFTTCNSEGDLVDLEDVELEQGDILDLLDDACDPLIKRIALLEGLLLKNGIKYPEEPMYGMASEIWEAFENNQDKE